MIAFRLAIESDFPTLVNRWGVMLPNTALPGDYLLALLASPVAGVVWTSPGWEQLDGFSTVQFTLGGVAQSPLSIPISYAMFGHFLEPDDDLSGTVLPQFSISGPPTSVVGASPGQAAGVALCAAYGGVSRAVPIRTRALASAPALSIAYNPTPVESIPAFTPVTVAVVPATYAQQNDWLIAPLITPGPGTAVGLPGASFILRASTVGGSGIVIGLADEQVNSSGFQSGLQWTATSMPTPLITHAVALWPDAANLGQEIALYAALDRNPVAFGYEYSQEPTVLCNSAGYLFRVYPGQRGLSVSVFNSSMLTANLLLTRPDGSTLTQPLTFAPDGRSAYCVSLLSWFPFTGRYYLQLQLNWANSAVQYSSQSYIVAQPQGGQ